MNENDDTPNHLESFIDPELEARIVALVLGEASDFEQEELNRLIEDQADLAHFRDRIAALHGLLDEVGSDEQAADDEDWVLSRDKRKDLLKFFDGPAKSDDSTTESEVEDEASEAEEPRWSGKRIAILAVGAAASLCLFAIVSNSETPPAVVASESKGIEYSKEAEPLHRFFADQDFGGKARLDGESGRTNFSQLDGGDNMDLAAYQPVPKKWQLNRANSEDEQQASKDSGIEFFGRKRAAKEGREAKSEEEPIAKPSGELAKAPEVEATTGANLPELKSQLESGQMGSGGVGVNRGFSGKQGNDLNGDIAVNAGGVIVVPGLDDRRFGSNGDKQGPPTGKTGPSFGRTNQPLIDDDSSKLSIDGAISISGSQRLGEAKSPSFSFSSPAARGPIVDSKNEASAKYDEAARDQTRSKFIAEVAKDWELPAPEVVEFDGFLNYGAVNSAGRAVATKEKAEVVAFDDSIATGAIVEKNFFNKESGVRFSIPANGTVASNGEKSAPSQVDRTLVDTEAKAKARVERIGGVRISEENKTKDRVERTEILDSITPKLNRPQISDANEIALGYKIDQSLDAGEARKDLQWLNRNPGRKVDLPHAPGYLFGTTGVEMKPVDSPERPSKPAGKSKELWGADKEEREELQKMEQALRKGLESGTELSISNRLATLENNRDFLDTKERRWRGQADDSVRSSSSIARLGPTYGDINVISGVESTAERRSEESSIYVDKDKVFIPRFDSDFDLGSLRPEMGAEADPADINILAKSSTVVQGGGRSVKRAYISHDGDLSKSEALVEKELPQVILRAKKSKPLANETLASTTPFSTFSLHVSDVSFKLAHAALMKGEWPDPQRIRMEEFVNAIDYDDPMPTQDERVAAKVEQAVHPSQQQRNLLRISMRTAAAGRNSSTPLNLTFLLDSSGSMERMDRQETLLRAFSLLAKQLGPKDKVTLIAFAKKPRLVADSYAGNRSDELIRLVTNLPEEGGTNIESALNLAFAKAKEIHTPNGQSRIILLTDGAANLGDANPERLSALVESMRDADIAFDAAGIGAEGLNDEILEALTRKGDGRYYLLDRPEDANTNFAAKIAGSLRPAAKNVKVQIEFNPLRVGHYKLYGFEKHRLKKEDFRNDKVDAAEMAAAEAGVALYQFEALPEGKGDIGSVSVRFRDMENGKMVEKRWPIPYQPYLHHLSHSSESIRLASIATFTAAKLKNDPLGETIAWSDLVALFGTLDPELQKCEQVDLLNQILTKAQSLQGK